MPVALRVLYVDDEPDLLDLAKLFLEEKGEFVIDTAYVRQRGTGAVEQGAV